MKENNIEISVIYIERARGRERESKLCEKIKEQIYINQSNEHTQERIVNRVTKENRKKDDVVEKKEERK